MFTTCVKIFTVLSQFRPAYLVHLSGSVEVLLESLQVLQVNLFGVLEQMGKVHLFSYDSDKIALWESCSFWNASTVAIWCTTYAVWFQVSSHSVQIRLHQMYARIVVLPAFMRLTVQNVPEVVIEDLDVGAANIPVLEK